MNRDLFLSVLAMDSYNRGYGERVVLSGETSKLGLATLGDDGLDLLDPVEVISSGFYASAYNWNGETIISYRGTDGNTITDALNGYGIALGYADQPQGNLATEFYSAVTGQSVFNPNVPSNVVVTGHSLGAGSRV